MSGLAPPNVLSYAGQVAVPSINRTFPPTTSFNDFNVPTIWTDTLHMNAYILVAKPLGVADWVLIGGVPGVLNTLTTPDSVVVVPTAGNINFLNGTGMNITGSGSSITFNVTGSFSSHFTADSGSATPSANNLNIFGAAGISTSGSGSTITISNAATVPTSFVTDSGTAVPAANSLTIHGTGGITTSGAGHTVTVDGSGFITSLTFTADAGSASPSASNVNILGGTTGITTTASGSTLELTGTLIVANGGTGNTTFTAYSVVCAGTTATNPFQNVSGLGTTGQVLTSNGAGTLPTWQTVSSTIFAITSVNHAASPYTVLAADQYLSVDSSGGTVTILLPNAPSTGRVLYIKDAKGASATNNITVTTVGGAVTIDGQTSQIMKSSYISINLIFDGTSYEIF